MSDRPLSSTTLPFPEVPDLQAPGVSIAAIAYRREDGMNSIAVRGAFRYPFEQLGAAPANALQLIAMIVTFGSRHLPFGFSAGRQKILFDDDIRRVGEDGAGTFQFDLFEESELAPASGEYFLSAAMGPYLSNVCRIAL
jgi:hypothetical protein